VFSVFSYKLAIDYGAHPILSIVWGVLYLSPIFMIGLLLSRKMACIEGLGLSFGYLLNTMSIVNIMSIPTILIFYFLITGISVGLIGSMVGEKFNIPRQRMAIDIAFGIVGLIMVFAFYYHFPFRPG